MHISIPDNGEIIFEIDSGNIQKFSTCRLWYDNKEKYRFLGEDYIYIYVENMLEQVRSIPTLNMPSLFGKVGSWQEYYYYDLAVVNTHKKELAQMEKTIWVSTEYFGIFLYKFKGKIWLEIDKGFDEQQSLKPDEYYANYKNYRVLLTFIPPRVLREWERKLLDIKEMYDF